MEEVKRWLVEKPTPLLWVSGPADCGKTTAVQIAIQTLAIDAPILRLSAFGTDHALAELGVEDERLTTKVLLRFATDRRLVIIDGLDAIQQSFGQSVGHVIDCRFRQLLLSACKKMPLTISIIVTSRLGPPDLLPEASITVLNMIESSDFSPVSLPASGSFEWRVLEFAALSRRVIDSSVIRRMSSLEEPLIQEVLSNCANAGLVTRVNQTSYQTSDWTRSSVLADATRAKTVRKAAIDALREDGSDPERLLDLLVDDGNINEAVMVYWNSLGNFKRLHQEGRDHYGAQLCHRLNGGFGPEEVSPSLSATEGAWAVMNDWSQFAACCGDAWTAARAADSAYQVLPESHPRWDAAILAAHVAKAILMTGNLRTAMSWCERSWESAVEAMRQTEGFAVEEIMDAYDWSANTIAKIYLRLNNLLEIQRLIDDLVAIHQHARQSIAEFNASSIIPLDAPSGEVKPEQLLNGRLAAMLALLEGRFAYLHPLAALDTETLVGREFLTFLLRAEILAGRNEQADALLMSLCASAEHRDDCAAECELAVLATSRIEDPGEQLVLVDTYLPRAEACALSLHYSDLQLVRANALENLGRCNEARDAAEAALFGKDKILGAYPNEDWVVVRKAISLLQSVGGNVPDEVLFGLDQNAPPERHSLKRAGARRPAASSNSGANARIEMHAAALRVIEAYNNKGMPFVVYFRKFGVEVLHGPFEFGPKLTENALRDGLPPEVEVITIQDHHSKTYDLRSSRFRREAPALLLEDDEWAEMARVLITHADLIVSEALMLSEGVRLELQMIYEANRWDRTVLVLPPQQDPLSTIDNDSLIQMFPRCIWADYMHRKPFTDSPLIADLLKRIGAIASVTLETRCGLSDFSARDKAFPIDLVPIAEHLELEAQLGSVFNQADKATRYYAFWQMFRAASIRGIRYTQGDRSVWNRCKFARSYIEMSKIMIDHSTEGDKFILQGDPAEAKLLVQSAYGLLGDAEDDLLVSALRAEAEDQWDSLLKLEQVMENNPLRFEVRPRYGPFVKRKIEQ